MNNIYGPINKSRWSVLFFAVPAIAIVGISIGLVITDTGSVAAVPGDITVRISAGLAMALLIWGAVFVTRPIITVTPDALVWPGGKRLDWKSVTKVEEGQSTSVVASANTGPRSVVHEVVRVFHDDQDITKIVTTWAAVGPQAANAQIIAAFHASR